MTPPFDICMFVHNDVSGDGRVLKEAASLAAAGWRVAVVGVSLGGAPRQAEEAVSGFTIFRVTPRLLRRQMPGSWGKLLRLLVAIPASARQIRRTKARVFHGNDFIGLLMLALAGIRRRPVVYDSHELFFDRFFRPGVRYPLQPLLRLVRPLEGVLARRAAAVITVSDSIADRLAQTLVIPRPLVLWNATDLRIVQPPVPFERGGRRIVAHSGSLLAGRHLPELVESLAHLPDDVALALIGNGPLREQLVAQARALGMADRLLTVYPVTPYNMVSTLAQADAAAVLTSPGYEVALPNKFFEAVAAGLPVAGTPLPEVAALLRQYDLGVTCDPTDPRSIAAAVQTILLPDNLAHYRENALRAREALNWEAEEQKLIALYRHILGEPSG